MRPGAAVTTVGEYIARQPPRARALLRQLRQLVREAAPAATEKLSYRMPYYELHGRLLYFAAFKRHIGFYPMASAVAAFEPELKRYARAKGSVRLPLDAPLPLGLLRRMVAFRVEENFAREAARRASKAAGGLGRPGRPGRSER